MDDLAFRKKLLAAPNQLDDEMLAYLERQPEQKKMVKKVRGFDLQIKEVLEVEIPEGLQARILLNQSYDDAKRGQAEQSGDEKGQDKRDNRANKVVAFWHKERNLSWLGLSAMAASLMVVAVSIALWQAPTQINKISGPEMIAHITKHIAEDSSLMTAVKLPKTEADMQTLFTSVGAHLNQSIDQMSYAGHCVIKGQIGLHIVMQTEKGPVTVIVMPGQQIASMQAFQASGYQGELVPVKGGLVAIVANTMEQLALAQIRFFKAVTFV